MDLSQPHLVADPAFGAELILLVAALAGLAAAFAAQILRTSRRGEDGLLPCAVPVHHGGTRRRVGPGCAWRPEPPGRGTRLSRWSCASCGAEDVSFDGAPPDLCDATHLRSDA